MRFVGPAVLLLIFAACGGVTTSSSGGPVPVGDPVPDQHRPNAGACHSNAAADAPACTSTAECNATTPASPGIAAAICFDGVCGPDQCLSDSDCPSEQVCSCAGQTRGYAGASPGNVCVPGNCRTDADCGPGGYCSPSTSSECGAFYGVQGYYCHKPGDACTNDSDCPDNGGPTRPYCAYDTASGKWACESGVCAG